jgi:hypothetical protein
MLAENLVSYSESCYKFLNIAITLSCVDVERYRSQNARKPFNIKNQISPVAEWY